jgi:spore coat protein A, manganese oxidase
MRWKRFSPPRRWIVMSLMVAGPALAVAAQSPQLPLKGSTIPQFVDPLPLLEVIDAGGSPIELQMREFQAQVLPAGMPKTTVWGYLLPGQTERASYVGPVIRATRHQPTEVKFVNQLGTASSTGVLAYRYALDATIHWADPLHAGANDCNHMLMPPAPGTECAQNPVGAIPAVPHLHGAEVPPQIDGGPDAWVTSDGAHRGPAFYSKDGPAAGNHMIYRYPNSQQGAPLWFHDHVLGATRLGVYAGLVGAYLIQDPANDPPNLPPTTVLMLQDRMFDTTGEFFFPADSAGGTLSALNPDHPYWVPEFVGDVNLVNGKVWPYHPVEARRYTFVLVNGANARTYELSLAGLATPPMMHVIANDGGYLDAPRPVRKLTIMPGERYTVIVDFAGVPAGSKLVLRNNGKTPYPSGTAPQGNGTGLVMQFRVSGPPRTPDTSFDPAVPGATLRGGPGQGPAMVRLSNPDTGKLAAGVNPLRTRQLTLNEIALPPQVAVNPVTGVLTSYPGGPLEVVLNNTEWGGRRAVGVDAAGMMIMQPRTDFTPTGLGNYVSERPDEGTTEVWEIVNLTADAHPIHLHLVQFQVLNRQVIDAKSYRAAYEAAFPGGGWDKMLNQPYPPGVFIPGFGPPLDYATGNPRALGGNPDIALVGKNGKPVFLQGAPVPPGAEESGWKDTAMVPPGMVTRYVVRWAPTDRPVQPGTGVAGTYPFDPDGGGAYVWHCHILDHEDNEMMRPSVVVPAAGATRTYVMGTDY